MIKTFSISFNKVEENNKKTSEELGEQTRKLELKLNEMQQKTNEEYKKKCEEIERKYKEKEEEDLKQKLEDEKKKLKERQDKIKEINDLYNNKLENIKSEEIELILKEFKEKDNSNLEEISKYDNNIISNLINQLLENKNVSQVILDKLNNYIEESKNKIEDISHLNILLVGPSGVGKSSLINAILELKNQTKTGIGLPQTTEIEYFSSEKSDFLRLYDTRGIEKNENEGAVAICKKLKDFILKQLESKNPNNYIHCIWYCWNGTRFEKAEIDIIKQLSEQYTFETLPTIIVYTIAIDNEQIKLAEKTIKETYKLNHDFIPILASEKTVISNEGENKTIKPYNLDKLKKKSFQLSKSAVKSSCYEGLIKDIKNHFNEEIHNFTETIQKYIIKKANDYLSNINEGIKIEIIYKECMNIILTVLMKYIFLDQELNVEIIENEINKDYENEITDKKEKENKDNYENENNNNIIKENVEFENNSICENLNDIKENNQNEKQKNQNIEKNRKERKEKDDNNLGSEVGNKDNDFNENKENNEINLQCENKTIENNIKEKKNENNNNNSENEIKKQCEEDNKNNMKELFDNKANEQYKKNEKDHNLIDNCQINNIKSSDINILEEKAEIENIKNYKKEGIKNGKDVQDRNDYYKNNEKESKDDGDKNKDSKKENLQNAKIDNNKIEICQEFENEINPKININNNKKENMEKHNKNKEINKNKLFEIKVENNNFELKGNTYIILEFIDKFFNKNKEIYDKKIDEIVSIYLNDLYDKILNLKFDFSNQYYDLFSPCLDSKEELKKTMNYGFSRKIELTLIKNSFIFLIYLLINNLKQYFIDLYSQEISKQEIKNHILEVIKISLDKIDEKIKSYNKLMEENKKNYEELPNSIDEEKLKIENDCDSLMNDSESEKE